VVVTPEIVPVVKVAPVVGLMSVRVNVPPVASTVTVCTAVMATDVLIPLARSIELTP
jgi:hypothetical protein